MVCIRPDVVEIYMIENNLSEIEFCEKCGICLKTLRKIMNYDPSVSKKTINKVKTFMNFHLWQLLQPVEEIKKSDF